MKREKEIQGIREIYEMLYQVLSEWECSNQYNYIPGTKEDGYKYYEDRMRTIRCEVIIRFPEEELIRKILRRIVEETRIFVQSFSVPGVVERWEKLYPTITYFDCIYTMIEELPGWNPMVTTMITFVPTEQDIRERKEYFERNLPYTTEQLFQRELLNTLEKVFEHDFRESISSSDILSWNDEFAKRNFPTGAEY